jgi:hypothetical protein
MQLVGEGEDQLMRSDQEIAVIREGIKSISGKR